jgi:hypothetical protein
MLIVPSRSHPKVKKFVEDEVTTTVFGPLRFMSSLEAWDAVVYAGLIKKDHTLAATAVRDHSIKFFHSFNNPNPRKVDWKRKSPDVVFHFDFGDGGKLWLVLEVKWNAKQSSHDNDGKGAQLAYQWIAIKPEAQREGARVRQAYLTLRRSDADAALDQAKQPTVDGYDYFEWREQAKPVAVTWLDLDKKLDDVALRNHSSIGRWAEDVRKFLEIRGVKLFDGFGKIVLDGDYSNVAFRFKRFGHPTTPCPMPFRFPGNEGHGP